VKRASHNAAHTDLLNACLAYLHLAGVMAWQVQAGGMKKGTHWIRLAPAGHPDIAGILPGGRALYVEVKTGVGKLTAAQAAWHLNATQAGALVLVVRDVRELQEAIRYAALAAGG
jgi:hypothetical protein